MIRRVARLLAVTCALGAGSCIVTDKIEFEDYVNNPPEVIEINPSNTEIQPICRTGDPPSFKVEVWDPDEGDAATYAAKLKMYVAYIPQPLDCSVGESFTTGEQVEEYKTGVRLSVTCEIDLQQYQGLEEGELLPFEVQISDLGFLTQSTVPDGARTAEVVWVRQVAPDDWCEN